MPTAQSGSALPPSWPGWLLGIAIGGFFDGILLHQILQWHHLLSGLQDPDVQDLKVQVLADGLFHALMYLLAAVGAWQWLRDAGGRMPRGPRLWAQLLGGFGAWHVFDVVVDHWLLGLHRTRMDVPEPLWWDLGWLAVFGIGALAASGWMQRRAGRSSALQDRSTIAAAVLAASVALLGAWAARAPAGPPTVVVVLAPGETPARALQIADGIDGRVLWVNGAGDVWLLTVPERLPHWAALRSGALLLAGGSVAAGCLGWSRPAALPAPG